MIFCLRALLIQKDTKPYDYVRRTASGLRALLIQKDTKHASCGCSSTFSLRALLIQKDTKLPNLYFESN